MTVESQVSIAEFCVATVKSSADQCADTCEELRQNERFGEIVVGSSIQSFDSLLHETARCQHKDWGLNPALAQFATNFDSTQAGQPHVQEDGIVGDIYGQFERLLPSFGHIDSVDIFSQGPGNEARHLALVFDQENPHKPN